MFNSMQDFETTDMLESDAWLPSSFDEDVSDGNAGELAEYQNIPFPVKRIPKGTATSVIGIKFDQGVMLAADTVITYGEIARFNDVPRVYKVNDKILVAGGADFADFQYVKNIINTKVVEDHTYFDNLFVSPRSIFAYLRHVYYERRMQLKPLMAELVVAGRNNDNTFFLGTIDLFGAAHESEVISTNFGSQLIMPLIRDRKPKERMFTEKEATEMLDKCVEILYYRDLRSSQNYMVGVCTNDSCEIKEPSIVGQNWILK